MRKKLLIVSILLLIPVGLFSIEYVKSVYLQNAYVKTCYKDNAKAFDEIASFFKQSFTESTSMIQYNQEEHILEKYSEDNCTSSNCYGEEFDTALSQLRDEYQQDSEYKVFLFIRAVFDDSGNMLLYLVVKSKKIAFPIRWFPGWGDCFRVSEYCEKSGTYLHERQASSYANYILDEYANVVDHP